MTCSVLSTAERTHALYKVSLLHSSPPGVERFSDSSLLPYRTHDALVSPSEVDDIIFANSSPAGKEKKKEKK
jgi:hypothetical protein